MDTDILQWGHGWIQMYCRWSRDVYSCIVEVAEMYCRGDMLQGGQV